MTEHAEKKVGKQPVILSKNCVLDLCNLEEYDEQDYELSVLVANEFALKLKEMGISNGVLVVRDKYRKEEGNICHYLARVRVGEEDAKLTEEAALLEEYSFVEGTEKVEGEITVIARLPAGTPVEASQRLEKHALGHYKNLLDEYYPEMVTTYDPNGARFDLNRQ